MTHRSMDFTSTRNFLILGLLAAGCRSLGPTTVPRDRFEFANSISDSWMKQNLFNIVKIRYLSPPIFVDVASVVSGYSVETGVTGGVNIGFSAGGADFANGAVSGKYTDRPTITYTPLTGNRFIRGLITPVEPEALFFTIQAGWAADAMLSIGLASINGLKNSTISMNGLSPPDDDFTRVTALFRSLQLSGAFGMRVMQDPTKRTTTILTFHTANASKEALDQAAELRRLLKLDSQVREIQLVFGSLPANDHEIAVQPRSLLGLMMIMAGEIEVPEEHVAEARTLRNIPDGERQLIRIHSSKASPPDAFVAVPYRDHWFWIDDRDLRSKRTFTFLMLLFTLADTGERENLPLVTIPAQ
jgi:hypothetical protein